MPNRNPPTDSHDSKMIEWMLRLSPDERLAELESGVAFFALMQTGHETELSRDTSGIE